MSEPANSERTSSESEKPVPGSDEIRFPPFPDPTDEDFEEDISEEERNFYKSKFKDLNIIKSLRLHCTACDRHLGCSARNESRMRAHPMLRTLVCHTCHAFYNSGEFEKGDDGSELYCRWCGQGGQVYCCSNCPHVFCAKCIKRNLGLPKIKEIENTDDWKCFRCNSNSLWDLRAMCWALLRYCDLKNKITYKTQDPHLKEAYQKDCALDHSECCKNKIKRREKQQETKKKEIESSAKKSLNTAQVISKIPPTIQVKKFASINAEDNSKDKKPQKRSLSPKSKPLYMDPLILSQGSKLINPMSMPCMPKKIRMINPPMSNPIRFANDKNLIQAATYTRIRPKQPHFPIPILGSQYNGLNTANFNTMFANDNINLSLENLTQGLDMAAVAAMNNTVANDDVVCTPDFPLEPLCEPSPGGDPRSPHHSSVGRRDALQAAEKLLPASEHPRSAPRHRDLHARVLLGLDAIRYEVTEDNNDDDVQCITPGPIAAPKITNPPPLVPRTGAVLHELSNDNIIQMTENDVTVNTATGGLKFRVDPQTLSSNKMYRLPDGRIFAINANPNMPGGYSATIVAVTENSTGKMTVPKGAIYAAKLNAVTTGKSTTPPPVKTPNNTISRSAQVKRINTPKTPKVTRAATTTTRECDLKVPVEWYRYNLVDAVDALEYSLSRLNKLKKEATTMHLRTRTVNEMRNLHRMLDRLLHTSSSRFDEIRDNLGKGLKRYLLKKTGNGNISDEDDDDVEILPDAEDNDDPIFIDENSMESNTNCHEGQEVDLTGTVSSDHNESYEKSVEKDDSFPKSNEEDPLDVTPATEKDPLSGSETESPVNENSNIANATINFSSNEGNIRNSNNNEHDRDADDAEKKIEHRSSDTEGTNTEFKNDEQVKVNGTQENTCIDNSVENKHKKEQLLEEDIECDKINEKVDLKDDSQDNDSKTQESELSEELIETLLKDDDGGNDNDNLNDKNNLDIAEDV